jgi:DNA-binding transcriptional MocR family regulator
MGTVFRYGNRFGYMPLREHLVRRLGSFGISANPSQILLTQGANSAMDLVIRYFVPPGATVLVDDPGYYLLFGKLKLANAKIIGVPRLSDGPDLEALEQLMAVYKPRLFFTQSSCHNPTGTDISPGKAFRILKLVQEHNVMIVENDALADFKPLSTPRLATLDQLERTIYIGSFSKSFSASLRVGYIACSDDLASELADLKTLVSTNSSEYCERTVNVILREGHYERHIVNLREHAAQATSVARDVLAQLGAEVLGSSAQALYLWASLPGHSDTHVLAQKLQKQNILLAPGRLFCVNSTEPCAWSRFNTGALADPKVSNALLLALQKIG